MPAFTHIFDIAAERAIAVTEHHALSVLTPPTPPPESTRSTRHCAALAVFA